MAGSPKHRVMRENKPYIIPHTTVSMKTLNIQSGGTSYTLENLFERKLTDALHSISWLMQRRLEACR